MTFSFVRIALAAVAASLCLPALAIQPHQPEGLVPDSASRLSAPRFLLPVVDFQENKAWASSDPAFRAFVAEAGAEWVARWDRRTGRLSAAWGTFPAWLPADARVRNDEERRATLAALDARCRDLMARHPGLFRLPVGEASLQIDPVRSVALDAGRVWQVSYSVVVGGVTVDQAAVFFRLNSGRLIQLGQEGLSDALGQAPTAPAISREAAALLGRREAASLVAAGEPKPDIARSVGEPRLMLLPLVEGEASGESRLGYRLVWETRQRIDDRIETWAARHDAITGERVALWDANHYACPPPATPQGRVVGGVYLGPIEEVPETLRGLPYTRVENGGAVTTDVNGAFPFTVGQDASTSLSGTYFDMNCMTCANPPQAFASTGAWGPLTLGTGGSNLTGNGLSTRAERNCFYHLNIVRQIASKHLDDAAVGGFFSRSTPANVNFNFTCNAFWDGNSVNFFRAGGGCNNTGEIADVMQHEWGHGIDQFTGGGADGARGEGIGDVVAFLSTHDARLGPYFFQGDGAGIRNADELANPAGLMSTTTVAANCPPDGGGGPLGYQVHCEGQIFSQAWWHLARNLRQKAVAAGGGEAAGWFVAEKLFFQSLPTSRTYVPTGPQSTYDAVMVVDDDNGDLTDGTPNGAEINEAFGHHGLAPATLVGDSADCVPPAAPAITLTSAQQAGSGLWQVRISWTAVPGALEYRVVRNQAEGLGADEPIATVMAPATEWLDDDVTDGVTYRYRVQAFLAPGPPNFSCVSIADNQQQITVAALPAVTLASWSFDDSGNPGGNFNGIADPGETLVIPITALNAGSLTATDVLAEMTSSAPGVTIVRGSQSLGTLVPGASASSADPHFAVMLDRAQVACGSIVPFVVSFESVEGCSTGGFNLQVGAPPEPCEAPDPRPRLRYENVSLSDGLAAGGSGDASGTAEPGELVRLPVELSNFGNATARNVRGTLTILGGPVGTIASDPDTPWLDIRAGERGTSSGAPAHVEVSVPADATCGTTIDMELRITYDGPTTTGHEIVQPLSMLVGRIIENVAFQDDFETSDNGFTHGASCGQPGCDDWQRGDPSQGAASDPPVAHSGIAVWGNDLGTLVGTGSNGTYRRNTTNWLHSPVIDCTSLVGTKLTYWRWLAVEAGEFDQARVRIATVPAPTDADWTTIWENPFAGNFEDTEWTYMEHDISALADGVATVQVRFEIVSDGGFELGGWNIDDLRVLTSDITCTNCSAIGPPASPGGSLRATGAKSQTSAEFSWAAAPALQPGEEWRLYRGTVASDVSTLLTPAEFTGSSFDDTNAPDALYFYNLVRANCLGLETR